MARGFELEPGETVIESWTAGIPNKKGSRTNYGGTLRVTDRRVVWEVLKVSTRKVFQVGSGGLISRAAIAAAAAGTSVVGAILGDRRGVSVPLEAITDVRPEPDHHAVLLIDTAEGQIRLLITASKWTYNKTRDRQTRDAAIETIDAARGSRA